MFNSTGFPNVRCNLCHKPITHKDFEGHITINKFTYVLCEDCYKKYADDNDGLLRELDIIAKEKFTKHK